MNVSLKIVGPLVAALAISACNAGGSSNMPAASGAAPGSPLTYKVAPQWMVNHEARTMCPQVVGKPTCLALQVLKNGVTPLCSPSSSCGFTAQQLEQAYNLTSQLGNGKGTNVAVIEAGDLAAASTDLATYRKQYGLGTANLTKYNESGQQSNYPPTCEDYGWCVETDLDIDMVSAACPKCNIFLMEAKGGISDFEAAEKARRFSATAGSATEATIAKIPTSRTTSTPRESHIWHRRVTPPTTPSAARRYSTP
jgi:hypothetical protein